MTRQGSGVGETLCARLAAGGALCILLLSLLPLSNSRASERNQDVRFQGANQYAAAAVGQELKRDGCRAIPAIYRVGAGDSLGIKVWGHPELSSQVVVRPDGRITAPLIEDVYVAGQTPSEIEGVLEGRFGSLVELPKVSVTVTGFVGDPTQQVRVIGSAVTPAAVPYRSGMRLIDVVTTIGGLSTFADGNASYVIRRDCVVTVEIPVRLDDLVDDGDISANIAIKPGDILVIPEGFFSGDWSIVLAESETLTFTDNVDLDPDDEKESAFFKTSRPTARIRAQTARLTAAVNAGASLRSQFGGGEDEGFSLDPRLAGTLTAELVENHVFVDADASVRQQLLDTGDRGSASDENTNNQETVQNYTISPYARYRLGNFADAEARYRLSAFMSGSGGSSGTDTASDSLTNEISLFLNSGRYFRMLGWTLTASGSEESRSDDDDVSRRDVFLNLIYPVTRALDVTAGVGYQNFDDGTPINEINGPTWQAGMRFHPSPDFDLDASYGMLNGDMSANVRLRYDIGPHTTLVGRVSDKLQTSQSRTLLDITDVIIDDDGNLIDPETGLPFDPNDPFSIRDATTRIQSYSALLTHRRGVHTVTLSAFKANETADELDEETDILNLAASWGVRLDERTSAAVRGSYRQSDFIDEDRTDDTYRFIASLNHNLYKSFDATLSYVFQMRESTDPEDEFTENAFTIAIRYTY